MKTKNSKNLLKKHNKICQDTNKNCKTTGQVNVALREKSILLGVKHQYAGKLTIHIKPTT
jgi:hypothetical protein